MNSAKAFKGINLSAKFNLFFTFINADKYLMIQCCNMTSK